jgi:hypothetical protein
MMKLFIEVLGHFAAVFAMLVFFLAFYVRWQQVYRIGHGHFIVGMIAVGLTFITFLVTMFAYQFFTLFIVIDLLATSLWLIYNDLFFYRAPMSADVLAGLK